MSAHGGGSRHPSAVENDTPSYWVEHLATFAVGREFGLLHPEDGVRKLKQLENNSAIWAQPMVLRLRPNVVSVEDENGDLVEQFPMELVTNPTPHLSTNPRDVYNNILLFIVKEDKKRGRSSNPTEMHIFQCNRVSANDVADDMKAFLSGHYKKVRTGRRDTGFMIGYQQPVMMGPVPRGYRDDTSASSDSSESFERDVNTLNRCFDDIERFVARIQSAAIAQRELEAQAHRQRTHRKQSSRAPVDPQSGILQMRAQLPAEFEFVDILQKFKLSFNLLAKLKNHIHEPNAPELLHFLFTPLTIILDACRWGLGRNIAPQVVSPLLSRETRELLQNCLTSRESDVWMALGEAWRIPPEDWIGPLPKPYRPVFLDGFAPYGHPDNYGGPPVPPFRYQQPVPMPQPIHRGMSAPPPPTQNSYTHRPPIRDRSVDNLNMDLDHMSLEKERLDFEREKIAERERRLMEDERRIRQEKQRLAAEKEMIAQEVEQRSMGSSYTGRQNETSRQPSPAMSRRPHYQPQVNNNEQQRMTPLTGPILQPDQSPRQRAFLDDIIARHAKLVQVTHNRVAQNPKELTVSQGEFLEVLNDSKNWWECTNVHHRVGYVPHTILSVVSVDRSSPQSLPPQDPTLHVDRMPSQGNAVAHRGAPSSLSPRPGMMSDDTPEYIKQRQEQQPSNNGSQQPYPASIPAVQQPPNQIYPPPPPPQQPYVLPQAYTPLQPQYIIALQQPYAPPQSQQPFTNGPQQPYLPQQPQQQPSYNANNSESVPSQPPAPIPQPRQTNVPPPPPTMVEEINSIKLRATQKRKERPELKEVKKNNDEENDEQNGEQKEQEMKKIIALHRNVGIPVPPAEHMKEVRATIGTAKAIKLHDKDKPNAVRKERIQLTQESSVQQVQDWLTEKGFSARVHDLLEDLNGTYLFSLSRPKLVEACGKEEGNRLYSQILLLKNKLMYQTPSRIELNAILKHRKTHVETTNEAAAEEPDMPAP